MKHNINHIVQSVFSGPLLLSRNYIQIYIYREPCISRLTQVKSAIGNSGQQLFCLISYLTNPILYSQRFAYLFHVFSREFIFNFRYLRGEKDS